ncbi:TPA: hypothetical protein I7221_13175 [Vibrio vulnificus]|nr:hypothetical protein [Vibrio vulnificus]HAT8556940.1 hypothetical protein [Vibrio vulnificus]HDY8098671.1 hypothetical protein [Vibrio vulnificus]
MGTKTIEEIIFFLKKFASPYLVTLYEVIFRPKDFICKQDFNSTSGFIAASQFGVFVSILNLLLVYPSLRIAGVEVENPYFLVVDTIMTYIFFFLYGMFFHIIAKLLLGKGNLQSSVTAFLYSTAFFPLFAIFSLPMDFVLRQYLIKHNGSYESLFATEAGNLLIGSPAIIVATVLSIVVFVFYFKNLCLIYSQIHKFGMFRTFLSVLVGVISWVTISALLSLPIASILHKSFLG